MMRSWRPRKQRGGERLGVKRLTVKLEKALHFFMPASCCHSLHSAQVPAWPRYPVPGGSDCARLLPARRVPCNADAVAVREAGTTTAGTHCLLSLASARAQAPFDSDETQGQR